MSVACKEVKGLCHHAMHASHCLVTWWESRQLHINTQTKSPCCWNAEVGEGREVLGKLWQDIVPEAVHFVRKHLKEPVTTVDNALVASCFNIMDALLRPYARYSICVELILT